MTQALTLTNTAQDTKTLKSVWQTLHAKSCPHHYNFHLHSQSSDGQLMPERIIDQALNIGLKGMALTDHHTVEGYRRAQEWLDTNAPEAQLHLWTGVEITARIHDTDVHILGYGFNPNHPAIQLYLQGEAPRGTAAEAAFVIAAIHGAGGLAVLAHPERYRRSAQELIPMVAQWGVDGVEAYYNYRRTNPWHASPQQTALVTALGDRFNLFKTCGTDTHGLDLLLRL